MLAMFLSKRRDGFGQGALLITVLKGRGGGGVVWAVTHLLGMLIPSCVGKHRQGVKIYLSELLQKGIL